MVLSLTTDSDGGESGYAALVAGEFGVPALDVKVVPAGTDRFGNGHGFNTSPSDGASAPITSATAKIKTRRSRSRGWRSRPTRRRSRGPTARGVSGDGSDPAPVMSIEDIAL